MESFMGFMFVILIIVLIFLFDGDPDLWDKLIMIANNWADAQLE